MRVSLGGSFSDAFQSSDWAAIIQWRQIWASVLGSKSISSNLAKVCNYEQTVVIYRKCLIRLERGAGVLLGGNAATCPTLANAFHADPCNVQGWQLLV